MSNSIVRQPVNRLKTLMTLALFAFCATPTVAQQAISNKPPKVFGPVKSIQYDYWSLNFNHDKTQIEELRENGRKVIWSLTTDGRLLSTEVFEGDGRPRGDKSVYNYDSDGHLTSILNYEKGALSSTDTITYPAPHRVKITSVSEPGKDSSIEIDEYDQAGNITKATVQLEDGMNTELYKYDDKGNPTEFVWLDPKGKQVEKDTYSYEFDSHGNWTMQRYASPSDRQQGIRPKRPTTRKIIYFE